MRNEERMNSKTYEAMSTDELRALIHEDIWEDTLDEDAREQITAELRRRAQDDPSFVEPRLDESWRRLQERLAQEPGIWELEPTKPRPKRNVRWLRTAIAAAAVFAVVCMAALPATAGGINPINYIATWTNNEFWLSPIRDFSEDSVKYGDLPRLLRKHYITEPLLPTWLPERYAYAGCEMDDDYFGGVLLRVRFQHMDTEEVIFLVILNHPTETNMYFPKDDTVVEEYSVNEIRHYLFSYNGNAIATWFNNETGCSLSGNITMDELKQIIDSIYLTSETYWK